VRRCDWPSSLAGKMGLEAVAQGDRLDKRRKPGLPHQREPEVRGCPRHHGNAFK